MNVFVLTLSAVLSIESFAASVFGKNFKVQKKMTAKEAITKYSTIKGNEIQVQGKVEKVCVKKGCWMTLSDTDKSIRVTFKDYGFFVPSSLQGKDVVLNGQLFEKVENVELQKHYLEDQGASKDQISKVTEDKKTYHFVASGVQQI